MDSMPFFPVRESPAEPEANLEAAFSSLANFLGKFRRGWLNGNHGLRLLEWRVVQLKGWTKVHGRTLRWLHSDARFASRWIKNGFNIPLLILIHLHPALGTQRLA